MPEKNRRGLGRRQYLKATGAAAVGTSLAGCASDDPAAQTSEEPEETTEETEQTSEADEGPVDVKVLVLTHFEVGEYAGDTPGEFQRWYDGYDLSNEVEVPGAWAPVFYDDDGVAVTLTGMGHSFCGPSVAAILASSAFDFEDSYFLSAGISGAPPDVGTLGSVFVSDYVVNWDFGHRWAQEDDPRDLQGGEGPDQEFALQIYPGRPFDYVYELNEDLVNKAVSLSEGVDLEDSDRAKEYRELYPQEAANRDPFLDVGTTVSGEEYWHGPTFSDQAQYIADEYEASTYATTEMEDYATATAVKQHGHLDRYLSIRSVSNFDQPHPDQTVAESLEADSGGFIPSITNVYRVGSRLVDDIVENWEDWEDGVP